MPCRFFSRWLSFSAYSLALLLCAAVGHAQTLTAAASLPSAPLPQPIAPEAQQHTDNAVNLAAPKPQAKYYWRTIPPAYQAQPLNAVGKLKFSFHEMTAPAGLIPAVISAGLGIYTNSDPKYGTDAGGFGERFGGAVVRQASFRFLSDGAFPILFREDPRYYRMGESQPFAKRAGYALTREFVTRTDSGGRSFNYSDIAGRAIGAALTQAYYPGVSRGSTVVFRTFGVAVAGEMGLNFLREFFTRRNF